MFVLQADAIIIIRACVRCAQAVRMTMYVCVCVRCHKRPYANSENGDELFAINAAILHAFFYIACVCVFLGYA